MKISFAVVLAVSVSSMRMHHAASATPTQEQKHSPTSRLRRTKKVGRPATRSSRGARDHDHADGDGTAPKKEGHAHDDAPKELDRKDDVFAIFLNGTFSSSNVPEDNDLPPGEGFGNYTAPDGDFDFFEGFVPPCPPKEVLVALNVTVEELGCDTIWMPPCPPEKFASRLGGTNESMDCDPDFNFFEELFFFNETGLPCPIDEELYELEEFFGFNCDPNATWWPNGTSWEFFEDFNYTTIECTAPVACDLYGGAASGIVVCSSRHSHGRFFDFDHGAGDYSSSITTNQAWSMCILPNESVEGDVCGCCGGDCPKPCTGSKCKVPHSSTEVDGVWVADLEFGFAECTTADGSVTLQLDGYYTCLDTCSS